MFLIYLILAILGGVSIVVARTINSKLATHIGIFEGTLFNYITGLLTSILVFLVIGDLAAIKDIGNSNIPLWAYIGGLIGIMVVTLSSFVATKISVFYLTIIMFIGQIFTGVLVDYFREGNLSLSKILGGLIVAAGLGYNLIIDSKIDTSEKGNKSLEVS